MLVEAQGCQRLPLSKPAVGQTIALHAVPTDRTSAHQVSANSVHSTSFLPKLLICSVVPRMLKFVLTCLPVKELCLL